MVLWTRLTGAGLAERVPVRWEIADDERLRAHRRARRRDRRGRLGAQRPCRAGRPRRRPLVLVPLQRARPAQPDRPHAHRARRRRRRGDAATSRSRAASATTSATTRRGATSPARTLDLVVFLGDYIYEYASRPDALRRDEGGRRPHARPVPRPLRHVQERPALQAAHARRAVAAGLGRPRGRQRLREPAAAGARAPTSRRGAPPPTGPTGSTCRFRRRCARRGADMRIIGRLDWGRLARIHLLDDRQYRDPRPARSRAAAARTPSAPPTAPSSPIRAARLLGAAQERWLADGWDATRPWNLLAQQTLMARFAWTDPALGAGIYWTDGWDGYPRGAQPPARHRRANEGARRRRARRRRAQQLRRRPASADFDDPRSPRRRERVLRHLDHEPVARAGAHRRRARLQPARPLRPLRPARLRRASSSTRSSCRRGCRRSTVRSTRERSRRRRASSSTRRSRA